MKFLSGLLDRIFVIISVIVFSQAPAFIGQYQHRLGGHVEELRYHVNILKQTAGYTNKTLEQYVHKFLQSTDPDFSQQGVVMDEMYKRFNRLSEALASLEQASVVKRPVVFLSTLNMDIAKKTLNDFSLSIAFTYETLVYAGVGLCISVGLIFLVRRALRSLFKRRPQSVV